MNFIFIITFLFITAACGSKEISSIEPPKEEVTQEDKLQKELAEESFIEKVNLTEEQLYDYDAE